MINHLVPSYTDFRCTCYMYVPLLVEQFCYLVISCSSFAYVSRIRTGTYFYLCGSLTETRMFFAPLRSSANNRQKKARQTSEKWLRNTEHHIC